MELDLPARNNITLKIKTPKICQGKYDMNLEAEEEREGNGNDETNGDNESLCIAAIETA